MIRRARTEDVAVLSDIERDADAAFRDHGMAAIVDGVTMPHPELLRYQREGRAWVDTDASDRPVAFLLVDVIEDAAHIEQISVHPAHARQGRGRRLIDTADEWASGRGLAALTLTTFADVPWNAPYYARLGFDVVAPDQLSAGLRAVLQHESDAGLDAWPRVAMRRPLRILHLERGALPAV